MGFDRRRAWTAHDRERIDLGKFFTFATSNLQNRWHRLRIHAARIVAWARLHIRRPPRAPAAPSLADARP